MSENQNISDLTLFLNKALDIQPPNFLEKTTLDLKAREFHAYVVFSPQHRGNKVCEDCQRTIDKINKAGGEKIYTHSDLFDFKTFIHLRHVDTQDSVDEILKSCDVSELKDILNSLKDLNNIKIIDLNKELMGEKLNSENGFKKFKEILDKLDLDFDGNKTEKKETTKRDSSGIPRNNCSTFDLGKMTDFRSFNLDNFIKIKEMLEKMKKNK